MKSTRLELQFSDAERLGKPAPSNTQSKENCSKQLARHRTVALVHSRASSRRAKRQRVRLATLPANSSNRATRTHCRKRLLTGLHAYGLVKTLAAKVGNQKKKKNQSYGRGTEKEFVCKKNSLSYGMTKHTSAFFASLFSTPVLELPANV